MRIDRHSSLVLTVIALSLVVIAARLLLSPRPSYATRPIEYKMARFEYAAWPAVAVRNQELFTMLGKEGWELAAFIPGEVGSGTLIFKR